MDYTKEQVIAIVTEAKQAAKDAVAAHFAQHGENMYCGFAWVNIYKIRGNSKIGKFLKEAGVEQDYTRAFSIWNPSGSGTQDMWAKEVGADAAAKVFQNYGFVAYAGSRAD